MLPAHRARRKLADSPGGSVPTTGPRRAVGPAARVGDATREPDRPALPIGRRRRDRIAETVERFTARRLGERPFRWRPVSLGSARPESLAQPLVDLPVDRHVAARSSSTATSDTSVDDLHSPADPSNPHWSPINSRMGWADAIGGEPAAGHLSFGGRHLEPKTAMTDTTVQSILATTAPRRRRARSPDPQETREWLDALDGVDRRRGRRGAPAELVPCDRRARGGRAAWHPRPRNNPYRQHDPGRPEAHSRDPRSRSGLRHYFAGTQMAMVGARHKRQQRTGRARRAFSSAATLYDARLQPLLARPTDRAAATRLLPGTLVSGVRARVSRKGASRRANSSTSP